MKKAPLYAAISTACFLGLTATSASAIDMSVTELHFTGGDADSDGIADGFPLDCSAGPMGSTNQCYATTGTITNTTTNPDTSFGLFESIDPFFATPWAAAAVAYFDGFDGSTGMDNDTTADTANISNGTVTTDFGAITQSITPNPDGDPLTRDFTYSGTSGQGAFSYDFTLTENQVAWGTLFNWSVNGGISVLAIFDCGASGTDCVPVNSLMGNGPFVGSGAVFAGTGSNFTPTVADNTVATVVDTLINIDVLANATDRDETLPVTSPLVVTVVPGSGSAVVNVANDGTIDYTPTGLVGGDSDSFQYTVEDSAGLVSAPAVMNINITAAPNSPPVADGGTAIVDEDDVAGVSIGIGSVSTDTDLPAQALTFVNVEAGTPATDGTVTVNGAGTQITYVPNADFNGTDTFDYSVFDTVENSAAPGIITVTVNPINDALVCTDINLGTATDNELAIPTADLVATCTDIDTGDTLSYASVGASPQGGMIVDDGTGTTLTYTPAVGFEGIDTVSFSISDGTTTADANMIIQVGGDLLGNFTMLQSDGQRFGGTNDITFTFAPTVDLDNVATLNNDVTDLDFNLDIASDGPTAFFGATWIAHDIRVFGPGTYSFDSGCTAAEVRATGCAAGTAAVTGPPMTLTVPDGMVGAHMLFDWNGNNDLVVVNLWERNAVWDQLGATSPVNQLWALGGGIPPAEDATWELVSRDVNGDGFNGTPMVAGPFKGNYVNFNHKPSGAGAPAEPYTGTAPDTQSLGMSIWILLGSISALFGFRRYMKK